MFVCRSTATPSASTTRSDHGSSSARTAGRSRSPTTAASSSGRRSTGPRHGGASSSMLGKSRRSGRRDRSAPQNRPAVRIRRAHYDALIEAARSQGSPACSAEHLGRRDDPDGAAARVAGAEGAPYERPAQWLEPADGLAGGSASVGRACLLRFSIVPAASERRVSLFGERALGWIGSREHGAAGRATEWDRGDRDDVQCGALGWIGAGDPSCGDARAERGLRGRSQPLVWRRSGSALKRTVLGLLDPEWREHSRRLTIVVATLSDGRGRR